MYVCLSQGRTVFFTFKKKQLTVRNVLQKLVTKDQEREQALFASVREAEYARQQHDAEVRRLQQQLHAMRAQNAHKLKEEAVRCSRTEKELQEKLLRQKAELDKVRHLMCDNPSCYVSS